MTRDQRSQQRRIPAALSAYIYVSIPTLAIDPLGDPFTMTLNEQL